MPERRRNRKTEDRFKRFWEMRAGTYPMAFDNDQIKKTLRIISLVKDKGVDIKSKKILDIGCGTGIYTLPLAREAESVTGLDFSDTMIERLREEAVRNNFSNVDIIKGSWQDVDIMAARLKKSFDIVWCSMSMAIRDKEDFQKMEDCSKDWCVYNGWGRKRKNALMEEAFRVHGLNYGPPHQGVAVAYNVLKDTGRSPVIDYFDDSWEWEGTVDEAIEDLAGFIETRGSTADRTKLRELLGCNVQDGLIRHTTYVEQGVIVWHVD